MLVQIYSDFNEMVDNEDTRAENVYPYKKLFAAGEHYVTYAFTDIYYTYIVFYLSITVSQLKRSIYRFILRAFYFSSPDF